jgi:hypothetical protein
MTHRDKAEDIFDSLVTRLVIKDEEEDREQCIQIIENTLRWYDRKTDLHLNKVFAPDERT